MTSPAPAAAPRARVLSGIQPTGEFHVGNYLGAVRTWRRQVEEGKEETLFCVVDAHAITLPHSPAELRERILTLATDLIACGVDPAKTTLFVQSDVREHTELAWYLASVTSKGELERMTQWKEKGDQQEFSSAALFTYPVLMAADILLYKATVVPVGEDQLQHLELARDIARRFNHRFGKVFREPAPRLSSAPRIMGLDGLSKMSKSKGNVIPLFDPPDAFWKKLKGAYTDPKRLKLSDPGRPDPVPAEAWNGCNVFTMHKAVSPEETIAEVRDKCTGAKWGCVECKKVMFDNFDRELVPLRARRAELVDKPALVRDALAEGAAKAKALADATMTEVRSALGLGSR